MSQTANTADATPGENWWKARNSLFQMIKEGRSFSGGERNCCFLNLGQQSGSNPNGELPPQFATVSGLSGFDFPDDGRGIAVCDWDRDGDLDFWISNRNGPRLRFMNNQAPVRGNWISLKLVGNGTTTNRDAIGARVSLRVPNSSQHAPQTLTVSAGEGFISQSTKRLHFGLADSDGPAEVTVEWPAGEKETFRDLPVNERFEIAQGSGVATRLPATRVNLPDAPDAVEPQPTVAHVALLSPQVFPALEYVTADNRAHRLATDDNRPTLLTIWASWCQPCLTELSSWSANNSNSSLRILALSVDAIGADPISRDATSRIAQQISPTLDWGLLNADSLSRLQAYHDLFFFQVKPLPLPSSFLLDGSGRLIAIYRGPVSLDRVKQDLTRPRGSYQEQMDTAAIFPGRSSQAPHLEQTALRGDLQTAFRIGTWLETEANLGKAIQQFESITHTDADWDVGWQHLAKLHLTNGSLEDATAAAQRAIACNPNNARAHNTLALIASRQGNATRAIQLLHKATDLDPSFAGAHNNLAVEYASAGELDSAIRAWQSAIKADPIFAEAHTNLGSAYLAKRNVKAAITCYQRAIAIDARYLDAHLNLGTAYAQTGRFDAAIKQYKKVLEIDPSHKAALANLRRAMSLNQ